MSYWPKARIKYWPKFMVVIDTDQILQGTNILVTRPQHQADALCELIESYGGNPIRFPSMDIAAVETDHDLASRISAIADYDIAIFISANAVDYGLNLVSTWPPQTAIAAIGAASAKALQRHGLRVKLQPKDSYNSEALLAMPEMHDVRGKRILIFRGIGGRELLAHELNQRGAEVDYAECYQRVVPSLNAEQQQRLDNLCQSGKLHAITATSNESLQNLLTLFGDRNKSCLQQTTIIGVSPRMLAVAKTLGLRQPRIAAHASDIAIVDELIAWRSETALAASEN